MSTLLELSERELQFLKTAATQMDFALKAEWFRAFGTKPKNLHEKNLVVLATLSLFTAHASAVYAIDSEAVLTAISEAVDAIADREEAAHA